MCQIDSVSVMREGDVERQRVLLFLLVASEEKDTLRINTLLIINEQTAPLFRVSFARLMHSSADIRLIKPVELYKKKISREISLSRLIPKK